MRMREMVYSILIASASLAATATATATAADAAMPTAATAPAEMSPASAGGTRYIVQAADLRSARRDIDRVGAKVLQNLPIINAASADLSPRQVARLRKSLRRPCLRGSFADHRVHGIAGIAQPDHLTGGHGRQQPHDPADGNGELLPTLVYQTNYPMLVGADTLQQAGITGKGVTIAVLDSGLWKDPAQNYGSRILATIDVANGGSSPVTGDAYGHGTHMTSDCRRRAR